MACCTECDESRELPLARRQTSACSAAGGKPQRLNEKEVDELLHALGGSASAWTVVRDGGAIEKQFRAADFKEAVAYLTRVADVAEAAGHHPDMAITGWNTVTITLHTFSVHGLTKNDFIVAARVDEVPVKLAPPR